MTSVPKLARASVFAAKANCEPIVGYFDSRAPLCSSYSTREALPQRSLCGIVRRRNVSSSLKGEDPELQPNSLNVDLEIAGTLGLTAPSLFYLFKYRRLATTPRSLIFCNTLHSLSVEFIFF